MGLDNGLEIKGRTKGGKAFLEKYFSKPSETYNPTCYEFGYWRKCWNIRRRFLDVFSEKDYDGNGGKITLTLIDLEDVITHVLKYFLVEANWEYRGETSTVFSWYEEIPSIAESIHDIKIFLEEVEDSNLSDEDFEIAFYDSY